MKRKNNKQFYEDVRKRDGICLVGCQRKDGCYGPLEVHHIIKRSQGGADELNNGIVLCQKHHQMVHQGKIEADDLREVLKKYELPTSEMDRHKMFDVQSVMKIIASEASIDVINSAISGAGFYVEETEDGRRILHVRET